MKIAAILFLLLPVALFSQVVRDSHWMTNLARWRAFSPEQREEVKKRFEEFKSMPQQERTQFLEKVQRFRELNMGQREGLRKKFEFFRSLPLEQQQTIRRFVMRVRFMPPWRRRRIVWKIHELRQMPPQERETFLENRLWWHRLSDQQKEALRQFLFSENSSVPNP